MRRLGKLFGHRYRLDPGDPAYSARAGVRAVQLSLAGLGVTALAQGAIWLMTGSVAVLADTIHNLSDALTAVPLWIAFSLARRPPNRRFTYGYHRAEDLAGLVILAAIGLSAVGAAAEALRRLADPRLLAQAEWVVAAGVAGAGGNELVARYRMTVGRRIGSEALVADGYHARADALTSLAVVAAGLGSMVGLPWADPVAGLVVAGLIVVMLRHTGRRMLGRIMDAVDPGLVEAIGEVVEGVEGVGGVTALRVRWRGHRLAAEIAIAVRADLTVAEGHAICERVRHELLHGVPHEVDALVHLDPEGSVDAHRLTEHHRRPGGEGSGPGR